MEEKKKTLFTFDLNATQQEDLLVLLATGNYRNRVVPYSTAAVEGDGFNVTLYQQKKGKSTAKLVIQGSKAQDFVEFRLEPEVLKCAMLGYEDVHDPDRDAPHFGSDESGKGDYFGPLVVCCAYVDETLAPRMREMGVKDCKQMSDRQVLAVGAQLRRMLGPDGYAVVKFGNPAYNRVYSRMRNINRLLAWAHARAIEDLLEKRPQCKRGVLDQFAKTEDVVRRALMPLGKKVELVQRHKAESDIAVAAASVIAREIFLRAQLQLADEIYGPVKEGDDAKARFVPNGSSDPRVAQLAIDMVTRTEPKWLMNHCKCHFQTTDKVLAACGKSRKDLPPEGQVTSAAKNGEYGHD